MDAIFKKSTNVFNAVSLSIKEPHRYDKHGQLKPEYLEESVLYETNSVHDAGQKLDSDESGQKINV
jgi:hypothetical protein